VQLNEQASVMYVPTGGFGWVTRYLTNCGAARRTQATTNQWHGPTGVDGSRDCEPCPDRA
jgi:hypothetical protein